MIQKALSTELRNQLNAEEIRPPTGFIRIFDKELSRQLRILTPTAAARRSPREVAVRAVDNAFSITVKQVGRGTLDQAASKRILAALRKRADEVALKRVGAPPSIDASILTAEVKERADPASVTRLRIVMREEGLEWSVGEDENGAIRRTLTPE